MTTLERWNQLSKLIRYDPRCLSESQYRELISYARTRMDADPEYWQGKVKEYKKQLQRLREEWDNREESQPAYDYVKETRLKLVADFTEYYRKEYDEDGIPHLIDFLIRAIPPEKFQPAEVSRSWMDSAFFDHVKQLVEENGMLLHKAYIKNDEDFNQPPGSTATRFSRLSKKKAKGAEWSADGVKKVKTDQPLHPEIIAFRKKHDQRGRT